MAIVVRHVTATVTDTATQDFTHADLGGSGDIVGVILIWSKWNTSGDGGTPHARLGFGASDLTNDACIWTILEDNTGSQVADRGNATVTDDKSIRIYSHSAGSPSLVAEGSCSAIANGIRLAWSTQAGGGAGAYRVTAIIFSDTGSTLKMLVGSYTTTSTTVGDTANITSTGVNPDAVVLFSSWTGSSSATNLGFNVGVAVDDGGSPLSQDCFRWYADDGDGVGDPAAIMPAIDGDRYAGRNIGNSSVDGGQQVSAMGTAQFTLKNVLANESGGRLIHWIAFEGLSSQVVQYSPPTATGTDDVDFSAFSAAPQFVFGAFGHLETRGSVNRSALAGAMAVVCIDEDAVTTHAGTNEDAAGTMQCTSYYDSGGLALPADDSGDAATSALYEATRDSLSAGTLTLDYGAVDGTATPDWWFWGIEADAAAAQEFSGTPVAVPIAIPAGSLTFGALALAGTPVPVPVSVPAGSLSFGARALSGTALPVPLLTAAGSVSMSGLGLNGTPIPIPLVAQAASLDQGTLALTGTALAIPILTPAGSLDPGTLALSGTALAVPLVAPAATISEGAVALSGTPLAIPIAAAAGSLSYGAVALAGTPATVPLAIPAGSISMSGLGLLLDGVPVAVPLLTPAGALSHGTLALTGSALPIPILAPAASLDLPTITLDGAALPIPLLAPAGALSFGALALAGSPVAVPLLTPAATVASGLLLSGSPVAVPIATPPGGLSLGPLALAGSAVAIPLVVPAAAVTLPSLAISGAPVAVTLLIPAASLAVGTGLTGEPVPILISTPAGSLAYGTVALDGTAIAVTLVVPAGSVAQAGLLPGIVIQSTLYVETLRARRLYLETSRARSLRLVY